MNTTQTQTTVSFETATRLKLRIQTSRGNLTVEDLWDAPLTVLDEAHRDLSRQLREAEDGSLLVGRATGVTELALKRDLVRHVVEVRQAEAAEKATKMQRRAQAARVRELIAQKQDATLASKSADELTALLKDLEA